MFDHIIHIIYFIISEYIDIKSLLFVSKGVQNMMNENGYMKCICYNENRCDIQTFINRCLTHTCMLSTIKYMNITRPFKTNQLQLSNVDTIILNNCYITDQLRCVKKDCVKTLVLKNTDMGIVKEFPKLSCLKQLRRSYEMTHSCVSLDMVSTTLSELYIYCKYRVSLQSLILPNIKTIMIHGVIKDITSPKLENLVCSTIGEQTFITLCVKELNLFINGFGIYYKRLSPHLLDNLEEWEEGANKNIREMCKYIHISNYRHEWPRGISPTDFMKKVIHKYSYDHSTIIYRGVKKLAVIPKDDKYHWGFEEIVFDP